MFKKMAEVNPKLCQNDNDDFNINAINLPSSRKKNQNKVDYQICLKDKTKLKPIPIRSVRDLL